MMSSSGNVKLWIDPVTRIEGHLAVYVNIDVNTRTPVEGYTTAQMFRGFEVFLRGRPAADAIAITSRSCGVCGAAHANGSTLANDIASGFTPKPMGVVLRNMAYVMTDYIYDHSIILNVLEGPDYSEAIVSKLTPSCWSAAQSTPAEYSSIHGYRTIADIMKDLNPITGRIWQLTIHFQRLAREAGVLIYGRHSHPSTLIPGGITTDLSTGAMLFEEYYARLSRLTAWVKFVWAIWQDLHDFYVSQCNYELQGKTHDPPVEMAAGFGDDPEVYSNAYDNAGGDWRKLYGMLDEIYNARAEKPGLAIGHELYTTSVIEMNQGWLEFVDASFYHDWVKDNVLPPWGYWIKEDPVGNPIAFGNENLIPYHPWNKTTMPKPQAINFAEKYSWDAEPRIVLKDGRIAPIETNPISQLWVDTLKAESFQMAGQTWTSSNGTELKIYVPGNTVDDKLPPGTYEEMTITWKLPQYSTTIERLLARAVHMVSDAVIGWANLLYAFQLLASGKTETSRKWTQFAYPSFSYAFGWMQVPRGAVQHWLVQSNGRIQNYQYQAPTTKNVSPRNNRCTGPWTNQCTGPFEMSVLNSKVTEEIPPNEWTGLDYVRAVRSFDPCLACAVHINVKGEKGQVIKKIEKLVNSACAV